MRDQAQVQLYCGVDPFLLWIRSIRITEWAPAEMYRKNRGSCTAFSALSGDVVLVNQPPYTCNIVAAQFFLVIHNSKYSEEFFRLSFFLKSSGVSPWPKHLSTSRHRTEDKEFSFFVFLTITLVLVRICLVVDSKRYPINLCDRSVRLFS